MEQTTNQTVAQLAQLLHALITAPKSYLSPTLSALVGEFCRTKSQAGRSRGYVRRVPVTLRSLLDGAGSREAGSLSTAEIEEWVYQPGEIAARTRRNRLLTLRAVLAFGVRRGLLAHNAALAVDAPPLVYAPPVILTPPQARHALTVARQIDLSLMRALAIRFFGGIRSSEVNRMGEDVIDQAKGLIEVSAANAKTRARRLVTIQPNLAAWLALGGELPLRNPDKVFAQFTKALPWPWPRNAARKSFVSYHLAAFESAGRTALESGHSEAMLFGVYRAVASREAARAWFNVWPESGQLELLAA